MANFQVFKKRDGKYYYQFLTDHDLYILSSDGYVKKTDCIIAINQVKLYIGDSKSINIEQMTNDYYRFILSGSDQSVIGYSIPMRTKRHCNMWIGFLRETLPETSVIEIN